MKSFTLTALLLVLIALFASPIVADYVERRGYDQGFNALEARAPEPRRRGSGGSDDDDSTPTETGVSATATGNFAAPTNMANIAGAGIMAVVAGAAAMY